MKCLIVSDIHANWPALQAVLAAEPDADQIICLGDLVGYGPQPQECVLWAMGLKPSDCVIQGNQDRNCAAENLAESASGDRPLAICEKTNSLVTSEMKRFLADLRPIREFRLGDLQCVACHLPAKGQIACPFEHQSDQWPWESDIVLAGLPGKLFTLIGHPDLLLVAHRHFPLQQRWGTTLVINPGSVGMPADGDPRASYAVWHEGETKFHRVAYDIEQTVHAYDTLNLDSAIKEILVANLRSGRGRFHADADKTSEIGKGGQPCHA